MFQGIDLSSDTATKATPAMKKFMMDAPLGDEQKSEDPTTIKLEEMMAHLCGFDTAIFLPSATMANQIAICCLSEPGDVLFAAENSHIFLAESGGPAIHAKTLARPIPTTTGIFSAKDIEDHKGWSMGYRHPKAKLLSIENTVNWSGGQAWKQQELEEVVEYAKKNNLKLHLDGSRIFNASVKTTLSLKETCKGFDMVTVCLSKGLGCPIGALLVLNKNYLSKAMSLKHLMGGAMRQSGIIAAAGIYALENNILRLQEDHDNAQLLADHFNHFSNAIKVINPNPDTNIVLFEWISQDMLITEFNSECLKRGIRFSQIGKYKFRAVTHLDVTKKDILTVSKVIAEIVK